MRILWVCNIMLPMVAEHLGKEASNKEGWLTGLADMILKNCRIHCILMRRSRASIAEWNTSMASRIFSAETVERPFVAKVTDA